MAATGPAPGRSGGPSGEPGSVRNAGLHDVLAEFAEQAAWQLAVRHVRGREVPFELIEESGSSGVPLYCYRPLTDEFIRSRVGVLGRLPSYTRAARALEGFGGLEAYLRMRGEPRVPAAPAEQADAVLRSFLGRVFEDSSDFVLEPERARVRLRRARAHDLRRAHAGPGGRAGARPCRRLQGGDDRRGPLAGPRRRRGRRAAGDSAPRARRPTTPRRRRPSRC